MRIPHINCDYIGTVLHQLMIEELDRRGEVFAPAYDKKIAVIKPNHNVYVSGSFHKRDRLIFDYKQSKIIMKAIEEHYDAVGFDTRILFLRMEMLRVFFRRKIS